jgi:hypothetical protein
MRSLIKHLGEDGMSSDESEVDDELGVIIYRPKEMEWRPNVEKVMTIIDKQRMVDRDIYSFKGSKPGPRSRHKKKGTSRRKPPAGLPRSLYDKDWLKTQTKTKARKLHISKEKFVWMKVGSRKTTES